MKRRRLDDDNPATWREVFRDDAPDHERLVNLAPPDFQREMWRAVHTTIDIHIDHD